MQQVSLLHSQPNFSGKKDEIFNFFFIELENLGNLEHWDNNRKLVVLKLNCKDQALNFIVNDPIAWKINDFDQLKDLLAKKFTKTTSFAEKQQNFLVISQKQSQTGWTSRKCHSLANT